MLTRFVLLDLECVALPDAVDYLPKIEAPGNYTKQDSIDAYVQAETMRQMSRAALDPDCCQIVAFGFQDALMGAPRVMLAADETEEARRLESIWQMINRTTPMVGYGLTWYDAGVLVRRSQILGVKVPSEFYKQGKYRHEMIVELADFLTLNGMIEQKKGRGLDYHCRRLGISVPDSHTGSDIAELWRAGDLEGIEAHCQADMWRIRLLAERLDLVPAIPAHAEVA